MVGETKSTKLSDRELDVARYLLEGKTNKEIAQELGIAIRTVESHLTSIYVKLGVKSRIEAILYLSGSQSWISARNRLAFPQGNPQLKKENNTSILSKRIVFHSYPKKTSPMKKIVTCVIVILLAAVLVVMILGVFVFLRSQ